MVTRYDMAMDPNTTFAYEPDSGSFNVSLFRRELPHEDHIVRCATKEEAENLVYYLNMLKYYYAAAKVHTCGETARLVRLLQPHLPEDSEKLSDHEFVATVAARYWSRP